MGQWETPGWLLGGECPPSATFITVRVLSPGTVCFSTGADVVEGTALPGSGGAGVGEGLLGSFCLVLCWNSFSDTCFIGCSVHPFKACGSGVLCGPVATAHLGHFHSSPKETASRGPPLTWGESLCEAFGPAGAPIVGWWWVTDHKANRLIDHFLEQLKGLEQVRLGLK